MDDRSIILRHLLPRILFALTLVVLLASCSTSPSPPRASSTTSEPTTTTTTTPTAKVPCGVVASPEITFTSRTEPCAVTAAHVGVTIHLVLDTGILWSDPTTDSSIIEVDNIQRPTQGGGLQADLKTLAVGQATVTSAGGLACPPGQPCPALARVWSLHITVPG